ncbi:MAG TPA: cytochrome d ubiquinol oxidase subunit II [Burkholderiaceae bacterium]|nr:cytochrome d ubiquinol oxidase subunit II [Burkholderiaceae bacterium]
MIHTLTGALGLSMYDAAFWMPLAMAALFFLVVVAGVVLDGFDIGVGCLLPFAPPGARARMLALLSPWRDANEFWLLLGLGLLAAAFPHAWGPIMGALYLPLCLLAAGVLLRSACFELRLRAPREWQPYWAHGFAAGSWLTAFSHGMILSRVVTAYETGFVYALLAVFFGFGALAGYALLGASWLAMRQTGQLRLRAAMWARRMVRWVAAAVVAASLILLLANTGVFLKWGTFSNAWLVAAVWGLLLLCFIALEMSLQRMVYQTPRIPSLPFMLVLLVFLIVLSGLAYSFFPYLVLDEVTIWDGAASVQSLQWVLSAAVVALPVAIIFNVWVYWGMFGPSRPLEPPPYTG